MSKLKCCWCIIKTIVACRKWTPSRCEKCKKDKKVVVLRGWSSILFNIFKKKSEPKNVNDIARKFVPRYLYLICYRTFLRQTAAWFSTWTILNHSFGIMIENPLFCRLVEQVQLRQFFTWMKPWLRPGANGPRPFWTSMLTLTSSLVKDAVTTSFVLTFSKTTRPPSQFGNMDLITILTLIGEKSTSFIYWDAVEHRIFRTTSWISWKCTSFYSTEKNHK